MSTTWPHANCGTVHPHEDPMALLHRTAEVAIFIEHDAAETPEVS